MLTALVSLPSIDTQIFITHLTPDQVPGQKRGRTGNVSRRLPPPPSEFLITTSWGKELPGKRAHWSGWINPVSPKAVPGQSSNRACYIRTMQQNERIPFFFKLYLHEECELCNLHLILLAILLAYWKLITNQNFWCRSLGTRSSAWRQSHDPSAERQLRGNSLQVLSAEEHPKHRESSIKPKCDPLPTSQARQEVLYLFLLLIQLDMPTWMFWLQLRDPVPSEEQFGIKTEPVWLLADEGQQFHIPAPSS